MPLKIFCLLCHLLTLNACKSGPGVGKRGGGFFPASLPAIALFGAVRTCSTRATPRQTMAAPHPSAAQPKPGALPGMCCCCCSRRHRLPGGEREQPGRFRTLPAATLLQEGNLLASEDQVANQASGQGIPASLAACSVSLNACNKEAP